MRRASAETMGREDGERELRRFRGLEAIIIAAACVATAAICTYMVYSAL